MPETIKVSDLTEEDSENKKQGWKKIGSWIRVIAEYVAIIVLVKELIPTEIIAPYKETGLAVIILLGICTIMAIVISYIERTETNKKLTFTRKRSKQKLDQIEAEKNDLNNRIIELERKARYANVFHLLNKVFLDLHMDFNTRLTEAQCKIVLKNFCNSLVMVFDEITNSHCHVCIKGITKGGRNIPDRINKWKAGTIVRDGLRTSRVEIDAHKIDHLFNLNSDYQHIYEKINSHKERFYLCNDIPSQSDYKNTSFSMFKPGSHTFTCDASSNKESIWPLPYKSAMCVPIIMPRNNDESKNSFIGFLCVDCLEKNIFLEVSEIPILTGCADALYGPVKYYLDIISKNKKNEPQTSVAK